MEIQCLKHVFFKKIYYLHMCNSSFGFVYTSKSVFLVLHMCKFSVLVLHMPTHAYTPLHMSKKSEIASCMAWGFPVYGMERGLNVWHLIPINSPIKTIQHIFEIIFHLISDQVSDLIICQYVIYGYVSTLCVLSWLPKYNVWSRFSFLNLRFETSPYLLKHPGLFSACGPMGRKRMQKAG